MESTLIDELSSDPGLLDSRLQKTLAAILFHDVYVDDDKVSLETFLQSPLGMLLLFCNGTADGCSVESVEERQSVLWSRGREMCMMWFRSEASCGEVDVLKCGIVRGGCICAQCDEDALGEEITIGVGS